jgi:non-ribosomal peptide synthetase component F
MWHETATPYPNDTTLHALFFAQAVRTPGAIAIVDEQNELTYEQLALRVNSLAHALSDFGAGPNRHVGICLERCA